MAPHLPNYYNMKTKHMAAALAGMALLASCSTDYTDWVMPTLDNVQAAQTAKLTVAEEPAIDFASVSADSVTLFTPTVSGGDAAKTTYTVTLFNADRTAKQMLQASPKGKVLTADLKTAVQRLYGAKAVLRTLPLEVVGSVPVYGITAAVSATASASVKLAPSFVDTGYYLVGDFGGWDKATALPFVRQSGSTDAVFTLEVTSTGGDKYWKIIPQNNYDGNFWKEGSDGVLGTFVNGDDALKGFLTTTAPQAGKVVGAGTFRITLNATEQSYKVEKIG